MWRRVISVWLCLVATLAWAEVHVYVEEATGSAWLKYECTAGEVVRAWALDVSVDRGNIVGISDFFVGPSTPSDQGYGIFPASFRDHLAVDPGGGVDWTAGDYTPLAVAEDNPANTLPGLGSPGVTIELGALWDPSEADAVPGPTGVLCALQLSRGALVSVSANEDRAGVVPAEPDVILAPEFSGAFVQPPEVTGLSISNQVTTIHYAGGNLEGSQIVAGPWTNVGATNAIYVEPTSVYSSRFFRVYRR